MKIKYVENAWGTIRRAGEMYNAAYNFSKGEQGPSPDGSEQSKALQQKKAGCRLFRKVVRWCRKSIAGANRHDWIQVGLLVFMNVILIWFIYFRK